MNMDSWSLEEKIGCMIMIGFRGLSIGDDDPVASDLHRGRIGGVILFDTDLCLKSPVRNIASPSQLKALIEDIKKRSPRPVFVAVDQEGGLVARLKPRHGFLQTKSQAFLGKCDDPDITSRHARDMAKTLADMGFTLNFAPSVDLDINPLSPAIGQFERSFSYDPQVVVRHSRIVIDELKACGICPVIKHFPGHGSAASDSHKGFVDVTDSWQSIELEPYRQFIRDGTVSMIMTAHIVNRHLDPDLPATLSKRIIDDLLRRELAYRGIVISDDLNMKAISRHFGLETAVELAVNAGIDILLFGNNLSYDPHIAGRVHAIIMDLLNKKRITEERIDASFQRIMAVHSLS